MEFGILGVTCQKGLKVGSKMHMTICMDITVDFLHHQDSLHTKVTSLMVAKY